MTAPVSGACSGRKKSIVWGHFEKVKIGEGDTSRTKAICNYCQKLIMLIVRVVVLVIC